jgi:hypothetical protein
MSYLYKRSNRLWRFLIRHELTASVWAPIVEATRHRHLRFRRRLEQAVGEPSSALRGPAPAPAGV